MPPIRKSLATTATSSKPSSPPVTAFKTAKKIEDLIPSSCTSRYNADNHAGPSTLSEETSSARTKKSRANQSSVSSSRNTPGLSPDDKSRLMQELLGFHPRTVVDDIVENCRTQIYSIANTVDRKIRVDYGRRDGREATEEELFEMDQGINKLETLLESQMDIAFDRYADWCLTNTFTVPDGLDIVVPWHEDLDFERSEHIASSAEGEEGVQRKIDILRDQVVAMRKLKHQLALADKKLDKQVTGLELETTAVGFVLELAEEAGLTPLQDAAKLLSDAMTKLSEELLPFGTAVPHPRPKQELPDTSGGNASTKTWEYGRAAYLNWAVTMAENSAASATSTGMVHPTSKGQREIRELEMMTREAKSIADVQSLNKLGDGLNASSTS